MKRFRWDCIYDRIKDIENPVGAEIGVFQGKLSSNLLDLHKGLKLFMIDPWSSDTYAGKGNDSGPELYRERTQNDCKINLQKAVNAVKKYHRRGVIVQNFSADAVKSIPDKSLDFAFIDGDHSYKGCAEDIRLWLPKVKPGGWICGHDYGSYRGVIDAVNEAFPDGVEKDEDVTWFKQIK